MVKVTFKGHPINTSGSLPTVNSTAKDFVLVSGDLSEVSLASFAGKKKLLNIFPSLDTGICAASVKKFAEAAQQLPNTVVINISKDLPFAQGRFCMAEGVQGVQTLSSYRSSFPKDYGLEIAEGPLTGLCSRAVVILDENNRVLYSEQVPEIAQEPDYAKAIAVLSKHA